MMTVRRISETAGWAVKGPVASACQLFLEKLLRGGIRSWEPEYLYGLAAQLHVQMSMAGSMLAPKCSMSAA